MIGWLHESNEAIQKGCHRGMAVHKFYLGKWITVVNFNSILTLGNRIKMIVSRQGEVVMSHLIEYVNKKGKLRKNWTGEKQLCENQHACFVSEIIYKKIIHKFIYEIAKNWKQC